MVDHRWGNKPAIGAGSLSEPGKCDFRSPSTKIKITTVIQSAPTGHSERSDLLPRQEMIPRTLVKLRYRRGTKLNGARRTPQKIFQATTPQPWIRSSKLSAKSTTSATQAAKSSIVKRRPVATRALRPNAWYATSAKPMSFWSTSRHFAKTPAVYLVVMAAKKKNSNPKSHPEYLSPKGRLRSPTPIKTLTELNTVCGSVDCPTTTCIRVPSFCSTTLSSKGSRSLSGSCVPCSCCWYSSPACRTDDALSLGDKEPYMPPTLEANREAEFGACSRISFAPSRQDLAISLCLGASSSYLCCVGPSSNAAAEGDDSSRCSCCRSNDLDSLGNGDQPGVGAFSSSSIERTKEGSRAGISTKPAARDQDRAKFSKLLAPPTCAREFIRIEIDDLWRRKHKVSMVIFEYASALSHTSGDAEPASHASHHAMGHCRSEGGCSNDQTKPKARLRRIGHGCRAKPLSHVSTTFRAHSGPN